MKKSVVNEINLLEYTPQELRNLIISWGYPTYAGTQLAKWIYGQRVWDFEKMTNLSKPLRAKLVAQCCVDLPTQKYKALSSDGTVKYLLALSDGATVETVMIPSKISGKARKTICVSSQVGCNMGCKFCHTGTQKKERSLTHAEIVGQILFVQQDGFDLTNVVFMGMGEPLEQVDVTLRACETLTHELGCRFGHRKVTVSTCGLVPGLKRMMKESKVNLAISLHAPNQQVRAQMMPISQKYDMDQLLQVCRDEFPDNRKRITFEYVLLKGVNDSERDAKELVAKLHGVRAKINLLQFNPFPGAPYQRSDDQTAKHFSEICLSKGIQTNIRSSRGLDVMAACGQLKGEVHEIHRR